MKHVTRIMVGALRTRWLVRAPIWLYRWRLGVLFGSRLIMIEHVGRNSGTVRRVVLKVVEHPTPNTFVVVSGFGSRSHWYRNICVNPHVRLYQRSHKALVAIARPLPPNEANDSLERYAAAHPRAWAALQPVLTFTLRDQCETASPEVPVVAISLQP